MDNTIWLVIKNDLGQRTNLKVFNNSTAALQYKIASQKRNKQFFYEIESFHVFDEVVVPVV